MTLEFHTSKATTAMIASAFGLHGAEADPAVYDILQTLGLVSKNQWTAQAETILWRCLPYESSVDFKGGAAVSGCDRSCCCDDAFRH